MFSHRKKRNLVKILPFGILPMVFSITYSLLEKGILGNYDFYPSTGNPYLFNPIIPALIALVLGIFIGILEIFYLSNFFIKKSFAQKIIFKTIIYFGIVILSIFIISLLSTAYEFKANPLDPKVLESISKFFSSFALWSILLYFTIGLSFCLFYTEISDNIGQYVILNFFTGKYHKPVEEERIFMFLDMKSSTTIAEKLGHIKYFDLLNDYYRDLSDSIIKYGGEIYQYVGDEIVITWKVNNSNYVNCIECFLFMQESLLNKKEKYLKKYSVMPSFKAGIHSGKVTTGEIGKIKKEFLFTGDVLNTTARIQGLCNKFEVELLISKTISDSLKPKNIYNIVELGQTELRGKNEKMTLYAIK
ncbi:adenylate/guanylate cyclase domain-containing protein [Aquimarina litoralis]|uniref:adenylate/guanylate cyclase domain-containing protein n=1 Tax=Aquimarina litoralis TaxID=584605 RepID=UPI001C55EC5B|nr:adenylate/guanylate cyclase domain-containing protein [Aquimarina litoralis]MBW1296314.1 adenylate/guanylate cyclase domain-containing protein [Aquimarina litoralis]